MADAHATTAGITAEEMIQALDADQVDLPRPAIGIEYEGVDPGPVDGDSPAMMKMIRVAQETMAAHEGPVAYVVADHGESATLASGVRATLFTLTAFIRSGSAASIKRLSTRCLGTIIDEDDRITAFLCSRALGPALRAEIAAIEEDIVVSSCDVERDIAGMFELVVSEQMPQGLEDLDDRVVNNLLLGEVSLIACGPSDAGSYALRLLRSGDRAIEVFDLPFRVSRISGTVIEMKPGDAAALEAISIEQRRRTPNGPAN